MRDIQALFDAISDAGRMSRQNYHLTLGGAVEALRDVSDETPVRFADGSSPSRPHSYRGYYSDLAFEKADGAVTAGDFRKELNHALGNTFEGYKGGDFVMDDKTPLWAASYGSCGEAVVSGSMKDGAFVLETKILEG